MSIGNSVMQKMINKSDSEISDLQRKIDEINKQIIIYNKQNF